jgi:hypothetical protein
MLDFNYYVLLNHLKVAFDITYFRFWMKKIVVVLIHFVLQPYDILSLVPVIEGSGGSITDWKGDKLHWSVTSESRPASLNLSLLILISIQQVPFHSSRHVYTVISTRKHHRFINISYVLVSKFSCLTDKKLHRHNFNHARFCF